MLPSLKRLFAATLVSFAFCAPGFAADGDVSDPLEQPNRFVFYFNDGLDQLVFEPISKAYHYVMPQYAQDRVHHAVLNIQEPLSTVNYLLQGKFEASGESFIRFLANSTFGLAGLYDVTGEQSGDKLTDFNDTFAEWGIGSGPYLVLPLLGSSDFRNGVSQAADYYGDPVSWVFWTDKDIRHPDTDLYIKDGVELLDQRTHLLRPIDDLRKNSLDFYASARSIYLQRRDSKYGDKSQAATDTSQPDYN